MSASEKQNLKFSAILLAAGRSRRMGKENKLLLPLAGKPLLVHMLENLEASAVDEIIVVTGYDADAVGSVLPGRVRIVHNPNHLQGMTSTIQQGVRACAADTSGYLICLSDTPFIQAEDINQIIAAYPVAMNHTPNPIIIPHYAGHKGHPKLFASHYTKAILQHPDPEGLKQLFHTYAESVIPVAMDSDRILRDIDTPEMYQRYVQSEGL